MTLLELWQIRNPQSRRRGTMAGALKQQRYTFDDFLVLIRDKEKADLLDGVIHMASPEAPETNRLFVWLIGLLDDYVELLKLGEVFGSRVAFRLEGSSGPEPDIAFVLLLAEMTKRLPGVRRQSGDEPTRGLTRVRLAAPTRIARNAHMILRQRHPTMGKMVWQGEGKTCTGKRTRGLSCGLSRVE